MQVAHGSRLQKAPPCRDNLPGRLQAQSAPRYASGPRRSCHRRACRAAEREAFGAVAAPLSSEPEPSSSAQAVAQPADALAAVQRDELAEAAPAPAEPEFDVVQQLRLRFGSCCIPHPEKASYGGEDAFFVSEENGGAFGIADGVGGWQESGINPADYSKMFMEVAKAYIEGRDLAKDGQLGSVRLPPKQPASTIDNAGPRTPQGALDAAHQATRLPGSATACVVRLDPQQRAITAANLGDSGFIVVRDGEIVLQSEPLQHFFDCPFQFGAVPEHGSATDYAEDADLYQTEVRPGDVLIAATDGLWDNAYDDEVLQHLPQSAEDLDRAARALAELASHNANDGEYESPYTEEAIKQGMDLPWWQKIVTSTLDFNQLKIGKLMGGKIDDITVVMAMVEEAEVKVPRSPAGAADSAPPPAVIGEAAPAAAADVESSWDSKQSAVQNSSGQSGNGVRPGQEFSDMTGFAGKS